MQQMTGPRAFMRAALTHRRGAAKRASRLGRFALGLGEGRWHPAVMSRESVNAIWELVRRAPGGVSARQVEGVVRIINKHYERWFHVVYDSGRSSRSLVAAEQAALREVTVLLGM